MVYCVAISTNTQLGSYQSREKGVACVMVVMLKF